MSKKNLKLQHYMEHSFSIHTFGAYQRIRAFIRMFQKSEKHLGQKRLTFKDAFWIHGAIATAQFLFTILGPVIGVSIALAIFAVVGLPALVALGPIGAILTLAGSALAGYLLSGPIGALFTSSAQYGGRPKYNPLIDEDKVNDAVNNLGNLSDEEEEEVDGEKELEITTNAKIHKELNVIKKDRFSDDEEEEEKQEQSNGRSSRAKKKSTVVVKETRSSSQRRIKEVESDDSGNESDLSM